MLWVCSVFSLRRSGLNLTRTHSGASLVRGRRRSPWPHRLSEELANTRGPSGRFSSLALIHHTPPLFLSPPSPALPYFSVAGPITRRRFWGNKENSPAAERLRRVKNSLSVRRATKDKGATKQVQQFWTDSLVAEPAGLLLVFHSRLCRSRFCSPQVRRCPVWQAIHPHSHSFIVSPSLHWRCATEGTRSQKNWKIRNTVKKRKPDLKRQLRKFVYTW